MFIIMATDPQKQRFNIVFKQLGAGPSSCRYRGIAAGYPGKTRCDGN